jgi:predicted ATP-dependent serine protease
MNVFSSEMYGRPVSRSKVSASPKKRSRDEEEHNKEEKEKQKQKQKQKELTEEQRRAAERALAGESVLVTGAAGTGKSRVLGQVAAELRARANTVCAVTAATGAAAQQLGGSTLHAWAGVGRAEHSALPQQLLQVIIEHAMLCCVVVLCCVVLCSMCCVVLCAKEKFCACRKLSCPHQVTTPTAFVSR